MVKVKAPLAYIIKKKIFIKKKKKILETFFFPLLRIWLHTCITTQKNRQSIIFKYVYAD